METELIGATHQEFGEGLARKWRFPRQLRAAAGGHHNPEALPEALQPVGRVVQCADILCCHEKLGLDLTAHNEECTREQLAALGITEKQLEAVRKTLAGELKEAEMLLCSDAG